jgi:hypothetical protein
MNVFRTEISIDKPLSLIDYNDPIMFMGSCFAENIGARFLQGRFNCMVNPHGILYNPSSIANAINQIIKNKPINESQLVYKDGLYHSFDHHGDFSSTSKEEVLERINHSLQIAHKHLSTCKFLFITFGTAWVFENIEKQHIVANCHKFPAAHFQRYKLETNNIVKNYKTIIYDLKQFNPDLQVIFTVSPVRHIKDGAHGNQLSKSTLLLAIDQLMQIDNSLQYFPAYELMNDDLRDYRFYADDMLHPNSQAINYIWEKFCQKWFTTSALNFYKDALTIEKARSHRPLFANSPEYEKFVRSTLHKIETLSMLYPLANFKEDRDLFIARLEEQNFP